MLTLLYAQAEWPDAELLGVFFILVGITLISYVLRNTPLGFLWFIWKWFWIILLATLFMSYAKDEIKKWWGK